MLIRRRLMLDEAEDAALREAAISDMRTPADQARYMICQELIRRNLLLTRHQVPRQEDQANGRFMNCSQPRDSLRLNEHEIARQRGLLSREQQEEQNGEAAVAGR